MYLLTLPSLSLSLFLSIYLATPSSINKFTIAKLTVYVQFPFNVRRSHALARCFEKKSLSAISLGHGFFLYGCSILYKINMTLRPLFTFGSGLFSPNLFVVSFMNSLFSSQRLFHPGYFCTLAINNYGRKTGTYFRPGSMLFIILLPAHR